MPKIGYPAPLFTGTNVVTGQKYSLGDHQGSVILVAVSGLTWCGPCQFEAPILQEIWSTGLTLCSPVQFVMVSYLDDAAALRDKVEELGLTFPVLSFDPAVTA